MTIKEIEKQVESTREAREQMQRAQQENEKQAREYRIKADAAAIAGDVATYKELKALASDAEAVAYVCKRQLEAETENPVTKEQTVEAWDEYATGYNKKIAAKLEKVKKAKAAFIQEYLEAVDMQREACTTRERLAMYAGVKDDRIEGIYRMEYIPCKDGMSGGKPIVTLNGAGIKDPDAVTVLASLGKDSLQLINDERQQIMSAVVAGHRSR